MHEVSLMMGILESVEKVARDAHAARVTRINLVLGEMTEVVPETLDFAFEALSEGTICEGADLEVRYVPPKSRCYDCGHVFSHDRFHFACPACGSYSTELLEGREMLIENIEVDLPQEDGSSEDDGAAGGRVG